MKPANYLGLNVNEIIRWCIEIAIVYFMYTRQGVAPAFLVYAIFLSIEWRSVKSCFF